MFDFDDDGELLVCEAQVVKQDTERPSVQSEHKDESHDLSTLDVHTALLRGDDRASAQPEHRESTHVAIQELFTTDIEKVESDSEVSSASETVVYDRNLSVQSEVEEDRRDVEQSLAMDGGKFLIHNDERPPARSENREAEDMHAAMPTTCSSHEEYICFDAAGVLRGCCIGCGKCSSWSRKVSSSITWYPRKPHSMRSEIAEEVCQRCGCTSSQHEDLSSWLNSVRDSIYHFRKSHVDTRRPPPATSKLPAKTMRWDPADVALYVLTLGKYDYSLHGTLEPTLDSGVLVSVCVPTSTRRQDFHPLLYENFNRQNYQRKELVVVDIGERPSLFLQQKARQDARVVYRFFPAADATEDRSLRSDGTLAPVRLENWSLGLKRNLCCKLARGGVIAQFDDDDLYAPNYLSFMCEQLLSGIKKADDKGERLARNGEYPAIATLSEWHLMDMPDKTFRWLNPVTEDMPRQWRDPMIYGYGFSYIYTRAAWRLYAFPDVETSEDDKFMANLRRSKVLVTLVQLPQDLSGLVAHVCHSDNTGCMEWNGQKRQGKIVPMPNVFTELMPLINTLARKHPSSRAARPPPLPAPNQVTRYALPLLRFGAASKGKGKGKGGKGFGKRVQRLPFV